MDRRGFTLIEMMVAVSIFSIVMVVSIGALLSIVDANRKAQGQQNTFDNLDSVLENMSRNIRVGTNYRCIPGSSGAQMETPKDCLNGGDSFAFEANGGQSGNPNDQIVFRLNGTQIERSTTGGGASSFIPMTSPEIIVDGLTFYVRGSAPLPEALQPIVTISLYGHVGSNPKTRVDFNLQTTIVQRLFDI